MLRSRSFLPLLYGLQFVAALTASVPARAADAPRIARGAHRVSAALGAGATWTGFDDDGHWDDEKTPFIVEAGYQYAPLRWLEAGAGAQYLELGDAGEWRPDMRQRALLPWVGVRFHTTGDSLEVGVSVRAGAHVLWLTDVPDDDGSGARTHTWLGAQAALRPDVRLWVSSNLAFEIAPSLTLGAAKDSASVPGYYLREEAYFGSLAAVVGVVFAPD